MALAAEILADSPLAYWPGTPVVLGFDEGWIDFSGNLRTAYHSAAPVYRQGPIFPAASQLSTEFQQSNSDYLYSAHDSGWNFGDKFTIEFCIAYRSGGSQALIQKGIDGFGVRLGTDGTVVLDKVNTGIIATSGSTKVTGYNHVIITKNGSTTKIYVDGSDVTSPVTNYTISNTSYSVLIGKPWLVLDYLNSRVSDVAVYSTDLSAARAAAHYAAAQKTELKATPLGFTGTMAGSAVRRQRPGAALGFSGSMGGSAVRRQHVAATTAEFTGTMGSGIVRRQLTGAELGSSLTVDNTYWLRRVGVWAALSGGLTVAAETAVTYVLAADLGFSLRMRAGRDLAALPSEPEQQPPRLVLPIGVSTRMIETLSATHRTVVLIELLDPFSGLPTQQITTASSGSVTLDAGAAIRGRLELEIVDDGTRDLIPRTMFDRMTPYGTELRVSRGVRFPDGTAEAVMLGVFRVREVNVEDAGSELSMRVTGLDRFTRFTDARIERSTVIADGTNRIDAILQLAREVWPDVPTRMPTTGITMGQTIIERGEDRGEVMRDIATGAGMELFFDGSGTLTAQPVALSTDALRWTIQDGEGGTLVSASRDWDVERVYNKVIVSGEAIDDTPPFTAEAADLNPDSPTYYYGPFGRRPRFYVSGMINSQPSADATAQSILAKAVGTSQRVEFGALVNPALEPGSIVRVVRDRIGLAEKHTLDTVTIPLDATSPMSGSTRVVEVEGE